MPNLDDIHTHCLPTPEPNMQGNYLQQRKKVVNAQDQEAWLQIHNLDDWQAFVQPRLEALRQSLGKFPPQPQNLNTHVTNRFEGNGFSIENLVFESRKKVYVSANLYCPKPLRVSMPGILLVHSHHTPKTQGELQDMGMLWARAGCLVLVIDQFAYGDRRDHTFAPRQDYWFRSISSQQLYTLGDSLMGWMVWDIHRGIDLLLSCAGIDQQKIIVMGSVAGGGDPCAVAAALDERISCAVPFNFGGPQPETEYPLPKNASETFDYLGNGSWESTRNLKHSGAKSFLPWVIVGAIAPRKLIYAHEFEWDQDNDPVWHRLKQIYEWYDASDHLDYTKGFGLLKGRPPQASHCNNIGVPHRQRIYAALERWYSIGPPQEEPKERLNDETLQSITPEYRKQHDIPPVHHIFKQIAKTRKPQHPLSRETLQQNWASLLGSTEPSGEQSHSLSKEKTDTLEIERIIITTEQGIKIPTLLLKPIKNRTDHLIVVCAQSGKQNLLQARESQYTSLLEHGISICLPDLRGTGETAPDANRGFRSLASSQAATELMLGHTMLGKRLYDLQSVLQFCETQFPNISLWGDSLAQTNPPNFADPLINESPTPNPSEPLGGLLAILCALFRNDIQAVVASGLFTDFASFFENIFCYVPHDIVVPNAIEAGDINDITTTFSPMPLRLENLVDGRNCPATPEHIHEIFAETHDTYIENPTHLCISDTGNRTSDWFLKHLT